MFHECLKEQMNEYVGWLYSSLLIDRTTCTNGGKAHSEWKESNEKNRLTKPGKSFSIKMNFLLEAMWYP